MKVLFRIPAIILGILILQTCTDQADSKTSGSIRASVLQGTWYAGSKEALTKQVDDLLHSVPEPSANTNRIRALISPHAGYEWSGHCAAYGYKALKGTTYQRVIILAPSHHVSFRGGSILNVNAYQTPLGDIQLDKETCRSLLKSKWITTRPQVHSQEHSLEIQLPFLQRVLGEFKLVPIVIGDISPDECTEMAALIRPLLTPDTLLVMSSDFTHQGPRFGYKPFNKDIKENIQRLDFAAVNTILNLNVRGFWIFKQATKSTICGHNPIKIGLMAMPLQTQVEFLHYETSGEKTKEYSETVSYCSILFRERTDYLDEKEGQLLLTAARKTLEKTFQEGKVSEYSIPDNQITKRLQEQKGVFVTLNKQGALRGCIGHLVGDQPLYKAVPNTVILSAFGDRRFEQLQKSELKDVDIEISVMSPMKPVSTWKEIVLGRDGIVLKKKGKQALYLPQVALEQGWNIEDTLSHLSEKAGLKANDWKSGCSFQTFTAQVFGETFKNLKSNRP